MVHKPRRRCSVTKTSLFKCIVIFGTIVMINNVDEIFCRVVCKGPSLYLKKLPDGSFQEFQDSDKYSMFCQDNDDRESESMGIPKDCGTSVELCMDHNQPCYCSQKNFHITLKCRASELDTFPKIKCKRMINEIYVAGNKISNLTAGVLAGWKELTKLEMQHNDIRIIGENAFKDLNKLEYLNMDGNAITELTPGMTRGMEELRTLIMSSNGLLTIANHTFVDLHKLTELDLASNKISELTMEMLEGIVNLSSLSLSKNKLNKVQENVFKNVPKLLILDLAGNEFVKLTAGMFEGLQNLSTLVLMENRIRIIEWDTFKDLKNLKSLDLNGNKISELMPDTFKSLQELKILNLGNNEIGRIDDQTFKGLQDLTHLNLEHNEIQNLKIGVFRRLEVLRTLNLKNNKIYTIEKQAFAELAEVQELILSGNKISKLVSGMFEGLETLSSLDLQNNKIRSVEDHALVGVEKLLKLNLENNLITWTSRKVFENITRLELLKSDEQSLCCLMKNVSVCHPAADKPDSCGNLLPNSVLTICTTLVGIITILANLFVIMFRTTHKQFYTNKVNSLLVRNLAISDLFMGIYLIIVVIADFVYSGNYIEYDIEWRCSVWCNLAAVISTFSSSLTAFTLTIIAIERVLVIKSPFRMQAQEIKQMRMLLALSWVAASTIAIVPLPIFNINYFSNFYSRSSICLPLHISSNKRNGWEYSAFVFLVLYSIAFAIIVLSYVAIFWSASKTQRDVKQATARSPQQTILIFRMTLFVLADATCKIPVIILGVRSLSGDTIPPFIYNWIVIFVTPLSAALNPILYTFSSLSIAFKLVEYIKERSLRSPIVIKIKLKCRTPIYKKVR